MSPEELAEARHYAACYQAGYVHDLMHNLLDHIDQQAADIERLHLVIDSCHEDLNCKSDKIDELDVCLDEAEKLIRKNADQINGLLAQVAALKKIAEEERAVMLACAEDLHGIDEGHLIEARRQLSEERPEAFG